MSKYADVYYDPKSVGSFGGAEELWKAVGGKRKDAEAWLQTQDTYTLHRPARKRFARNRILVAGMDDQWEADLIDMQKQAPQNKNNKYILTVIDSLSKYAWALPLKDKTGESLVRAFKIIFKERQPRKLRTDRGKEFMNSKMQHLLKEKGIIYFTSSNETKCAIVERFNRTLQSKLWRYFTSTKKQRYIDMLQSFVDTYNRTRHSSTGIAPTHVNYKNAETVWRKLYNYKVKTRKPKFKEGDFVRISKAKGTFEKGYKTNWTREVFIVNKVIKRPLPEYKLVDQDGEDILGTFHNIELQRANRR